MHFDPAELACWTGGQWSASPPASIDGLHFDTRHLQPGAGFIALSHGMRDGHDFLEAALESGASCAIVEKKCGGSLPQLVVTNAMKALADIGQAQRERYRKPVIGITGSCGKTSTKAMLQACLGASRCHATPGNWNNTIGVPLTLFGLDSENQDYGVIEAGISEPGEMRALSAMIQPDLVIVTQIGSAHLEGLGSIEGVACEKSQLLAHARSDARLLVPESVYAFPEFKAHADRTCLVLEGEVPIPEPVPAQVVRYERTETGIKLLEVEYPFASASPGMCSNAALAIVATQLLGADLALGKSALAAWEPDEQRGQCLEHGNQIFYVDCYNANPDSMRDAMTAFEATVPTEAGRAYVLGAMNELGQASVALHEALGRSLRLRPKDRLWLVGPDELTAAYVVGAEAAGVLPEQMVTARSADEIKSGIAAFEGAVFLKGSRCFTLEALLPETLKLKLTRT
ncbi:MAG: UDP-N-acetylmuramoyl-tripeptide--D-alanyl-D-alanine ligase [Verrucomicrobia bacterium]|nr:UDP-N-acetylmuramoyl-tripeptide--D-alanyl-D-alanine ligase [Verrucomicrobiota bacterium]